MEVVGWTVTWASGEQEFYEGWEKPNSLDQEWSVLPVSIVAVYASSKNT